MSNEIMKDVVNMVMIQSAKSTAKGEKILVNYFMSQFNGGKLTSTNTEANGSLPDYSSRYHNMYNSFTSIIDASPELETDNAVRAILLLTQLEYSRDLFLLPSIEQKGKFAYSKNVDDDDAKRTVSTLGKIMRRRFGITPKQIRDEVIGKIAAHLIEYLWPSVDSVNRVYGQEIIDAYTIYSGISCMRGYNSKYVEIYKYNPDVVSLLTVENSTECVAKALLWDIPYNGLCLDRVYHHKDNFADAQSIIAYARTLNADVSDNCFRGRNDVSSSIDLDISSCTYLPYFDSFRGISGQEKNILTIDSSSNSQLETTDGSGLIECSHCGEHTIRYSDSCAYCGTHIESQIRCASCEEYCDEDDMTYIDNENVSVCHNCIDEYSYCEDCDRYYGNSDMIYVSGINTDVCNVCINNYYFCNDCEEYYDEEQMTYIEGADYSVCECCLDNNYTKCGDCDSYLENDDLTYLGCVGYSVCNSCLEKYSLCDHCGEYSESGVIHVPGPDIVVCEECLDQFPICEECGDRVPKEDTFFISNTMELVCNCCKEHHFFKCEYCGTFNREEDLDITEGEEMCTSCVSVLEAV